jgi:PKD domain
VPRASRRHIGTLAIAALAAGSLAATGVSATSAHATSALATGPLYAIGVPACGPPAPGHDACDAIRLQLVPAGTPGASVYHPLHATTANAADGSSGVTAGVANGLTPADIASAYGVNPKVGGANQTVAVIDAYNDPNARADLNVFDTHYLLPDETSTSLRIVNQTGAATPLPADDDATGWDEEVAIDLDAVRGLCNHCKILLVESDSDSAADMATAANEAATLGATEISNSYGSWESSSGPLSAAEVADYDHPGVVETASAGDDGWYAYDLLGSGGAVNSPDTPASLPSVIGVGGTTLTLNQNGTRAYETVWNDNGPNDQHQQVIGSNQQAAGGGCSTKYDAPSWQLHVAHYASLGCGTKRSSVDISGISDYLTGFDNYNSYAGSGHVFDWATAGGTSIASPIIAAMFALAGGAHGMAHPAEILYGHSGRGSPFYDVTVGGNSYCDAAAVCQSPGNQQIYSTNLNAATAQLLDCSTDITGKSLNDTAQCDAEPGYDGPSGLGAPNGLSEFTPANPTGVITAPAKLVAGKSAKFTAKHSTDPYPGGRITKYHWTFGSGSASTSESPSHRFEKAGTYVVQLVVTDSVGRTGTVKKRVKVKPKPKK